MDERFAKLKELRGQAFRVCSADMFPVITIMDETIKLAEEKYLTLNDKEVSCLGCGVPVNIPLCASCSIHEGN